MSTSDPARLSRRTLLRGAASASLLVVLAAVPGCSGDGGRPGAEGDDGSPSPMLALGRSLAAGPAFATLDAVPLLDLGAVRSDDDVVRAVVDGDVRIRADLAAGRVVVADGWLLSTTEGAVLVASAEACPMSSC